MDFENRKSKNSVTRIICILMSLLMILNIMTVSAYAEAEENNYIFAEGEENIIKGESDNISWSFDEKSGVLTVGGTVSLSEFNEDNLPWDAYKSYVKEIVFEEGIEDITADYSIYENLESITVPESVKALNDTVLAGNGKLNKLIILNAECTFEKKTDTVVTAVICSYDNSTAKAFAAENNLEFEAIECLHTKTSETEGKDSTCAEVGYTEGIFCEICKTYISGHDEITKAEHNWEAATCDTPKTCSACGETEGDAAGHKEEKIPGKKATCTENGITDGKKCTICRTVTVEQEEIVAPGHDWKEATCLSPKTCSTCKITSGSVLKHNWQVADCTNPRTCSYCKKTEGEALGHVWNDATCEHAKMCSRCKVTEGTALPHTVESLPARAATCTEAGLSEGRQCSVCGYMISVQRETVPAFGHIETEIPGKAATCTEDGYTAAKSCSLCGEVTSGQKEIPALGHSWREADCLNPKTCTVCYAVEGEALGHKEVKASGKKPTCTETGLTDGKKCSVCGLFTENQLVIAETGHNEIVTPGKDPTCTKKGSTDSARCTICGVETEASVQLDAYGHEWKEATCQAPKTCTVCKAKEGKVGTHKIVKVPAVAATYTKSGKTEGKKCQYCDKVTVKQKTVARKKLKKVSGLKVKSFTSASVTLSWKKTTGADSYKVYYSTDGKKWKSVKVKKNTATIKKLKSGTQYRFKVRAFAGKYYGDASSIVKKTTKVSKPTISSVNSAKKSQASVSWKQVSKADGYVVEYSTSKSFAKKTTNTVKINKGSTVKTTLKKLTSGKKYYVRVKAYKAVNKKAVYGSYSSIKTVKVK